MNGIAQHVSVVVPTMDRSDFVLRLLRYLQATHFGGHLFVGDSSGPCQHSRINHLLSCCRRVLPY